MKQSFTPQLRYWACLIWCFGMALIVVDFLSLPLFEWRVSGSYLFFLGAGFLTCWAEQREFSARIFLYRLHDAVIFTPWKFLLLYFLWISVFSPFTDTPLKSLLYAANGWLSLFAIGINAQFIFCERGINGVVLIPDRLRIAFLSYSVSVSFLMVNSLVHLFFPNSPFPILVNDQINLFLYFTIGLPFLLWDLLKDGRRMLPRWWCSLALLLGGMTTILIGRKFYYAALVFCVMAVVGLFLYKQMRLKKAIFLALGVGVVGSITAFGLRALLFTNTFWTNELERVSEAMAIKMKGSIAGTWEILVATNFLGEGLGLSSLRGVWVRVLAEAGVVGFGLYAAFFISVIIDLYRVRRSTRVVVSNVAIVSLGIFLLLASHFVENPYGAYVWVWYSIWALFAATPKKKKAFA